MRLTLREAFCWFTVACCVAAVVGYEVDRRRLIAELEKHEGDMPLFTHANIVDLETGEFHSYRAKRVIDKNSFMQSISEFAVLRNGGCERHRMRGDFRFASHDHPLHQITDVFVTDREVVVMTKEPNH